MNTSEEVHATILQHLLDLRSQWVHKVRLVSRLNNRDLLGGSQALPVHIFIPDLHLMSRADEEKYKYGFEKIGPNQRVARGKLLGKLCDQLVKFRSKLGSVNRLKVMLMGDVFDLWREQELDSEEGLTSLVNRIIKDHREVRSRLLIRDAGSLKPAILRGNHDWKIIGSTVGSRASIAKALSTDSGKTILAIHGHLFDAFENLIPDDLAEFVLERFRLQDASTYAVDRTPSRRDDEITGSQGAAPLTLERARDSLALPDWVNVWVTRERCSEFDLRESHHLLPLALGCARTVRSGRSRALKTLDLGEALPALRAIVIGHSHHARISVHFGKQSRDNLVLADCGAWLENSSFGAGDTVPSCQLGVLSGGDFRVYQLDPHADLYSRS